MFVGHGVAAFALVGAVALSRGIENHRALQLAIVAGLFATLPDIDILYGPLGLLNGVSGVFDATDAFWSTGNVVHRGPTHSLVFGTSAAAAFSLWRRSSAGRVVAATVLAGLAVLATATAGSVAGAVTVLFGVGGLVITQFAARRGLSSGAVLATALVGLVTHPFGDLFTGEPPTFLYPLDVPVVTERVALAADPTLHLLGAFGIELATLWLGLLVYLRLTGRGSRPQIDRKAVLGLSYAGAAVALPAPTLEASYQFVFTVLAFGVLGATQRQLFGRQLRAVDWPRACATGLAAVTAAALSYLVVYLAVL
ncbi:hydrolase [Halomicrobium mukohataei]|uniref:Hydrolase n=1 Tax=Halomicrobium mukohataei TaxID=57705 RepID=A0A847UH74_9EURY|nr:metal-dependent hydrolase [Halomicrobium mukohataei]NLV10874.1 hydrolase [Halomicrobium mukohataei]